LPSSRPYGAQNIHDYALKLGLGKNVGFELAGETCGFIPSPLWRKINKFQKWFDGFKKKTWVKLFCCYCRSKSAEIRSEATGFEAISPFLGAKNIFLLNKITK
jgi:cell division protein FtsI/penicillin-binding protein 2